MDEVRIKQALETIENHIASTNEALKKGNFTEVNKELDELKAAEKIYAGFVAHYNYEQLAKADAPMVAAAKQYDYDVVTHEENKLSGSNVTVSVSIKKDAKKKIDLLDFCKTQGLPTDWQYACERACQLFVLDTAIDLGFTPEQVKTMTDSIFFSKKAAQYYEAQKDTSMPDPTSNNSLNKALNDVVAMTIGEGYHSNTFDVRYIKRVFNKKGKSGLVLACGKPSYFRQIMLDVLFRIVTNSTYGVAFDMRDAEGKRKEGILFADGANYNPVEAPVAPAKAPKSGKKSAKKA